MHNSNGINDQPYEFEFDSENMTGELGRYNNNISNISRGMNY